MSETSVFNPEWEIQKQKKPYWDTGLDAHKWIGIEEGKAERLRVMANKISFLVDNEIFDNYKNEGKNKSQYKLEFYDALSRNENEFKSGSHKEIGKFINYLDSFQSITDDKKEIPDFYVKTPYEEMDELVNDLKILKHSGDIEQKEQIQEKLSSLFKAEDAYRIAIDARGLKKAA